MKLVFIFTILSLISLQTLGFSAIQIKKDWYIPEQFVNHQLNDFMYNMDTDYSKFYQPLLKHLEKTLPYLQEVAKNYQETMTTLNSTSKLISLKTVNTVRTGLMMH